MELVNWTGGWVEGLMLGGVHDCTGGHGLFDGSMDVDGVMLGGIHNAMGGSWMWWIGRMGGWIDDRRPAYCNCYIMEVAHRRPIRLFLLLYEARRAGFGFVPLISHLMPSCCSAAFVTFLSVLRKFVRQLWAVRT